MADTNRYRQERLSWRLNSPGVAMSVARPNFTNTQRDRAVGVLIGMAAGDALGAGYEFEPPMEADTPTAMIGGGLGPFEPGEWTDDTSMAIAIAEIAATGAALRDEISHDYIVERWHLWSRTAKDVGVQTSTVLSAAAQDGVSARTARDAAAALHARTGRSAGNGSLMRTAPVTLAYLDDPDELARAAREISELTHFDPEAGDACVLWCLAIRHAVLTGDLDVRVGLPAISADRLTYWERRLTDAECSRPSDFASTNGWVVAALQGAWSAIINTPVPNDDPDAGVFPADHLRLALEAAIRGGGDTDTVAAIAGALLGATGGVTAVPAHWRSILHGWPGIDARGLTQMAERIIDKGARPLPTWAPDDAVLVQHPYDVDMYLGNVAALQQLPKKVDAVVSLCRVHDDEIPSGVEHLDVRLIDRVGDNANLDFVLLDTVRAIERLRAEGRTVFLHCVAAQSRTPTVAALYGARRRGVGIEEALQDVCAVLSDTDPNPDFRASIRRLCPTGESVAVALRPI